LLHNTKEILGMVASQQESSGPPI